MKKKSPMNQTGSFGILSEGDFYTPTFSHKTKKIFFLKCNFETLEMTSTNRFCDRP